MKRVIIMRGLPGSGKSTMTSALMQGYAVIGASVKIVSADHYFTKPDGIYEFDRDSLPIAHSRCMTAFANAVEFGTQVIIVDNCNVKRKDFHWYATLANEMGYEVFEVAVGNRDVATSLARNTHGVPRDILEKMVAEWEP